MAKLNKAISLSARRTHSHRQTKTKEVPPSKLLPPPLLRNMKIYDWLLLVGDSILTAAQTTYYIQCICIYVYIYIYARTCSGIAQNVQQLAQQKCLTTCLFRCKGFLDECMWIYLQNCLQPKLSSQSMLMKAALYAQIWGKYIFALHQQRVQRHVHFRFNGPTN